MGTFVLRMSAAAAEAKAEPSGSFSSILMHVCIITYVCVPKMYVRMYMCVCVSACAVREPQVLLMTKPGEVKALPAVERKMPWVLPPGGKLTAETSVRCVPQQLP